MNGLRWIALGLFWLAITITVQATELEKIRFWQDVFVAGQEGYHTFRIPALVRSNQGTLLAFCEGRKNNPGDEGDIDLLLKRSRDGGRNWSKRIVVYEEGKDAPITIGNPCPVVDRRSGRIHLLFTRNNKRLFHTSSSDDGKSWDSPTEFTEILQQFDYPLIRIATGPVHGIQTSQGRLLAPIWVCDRERKDVNKDITNGRYRSGILYSDNNGERWQAGGLVPPEVSRLNECTIVELRDGSLLLNMRARDAGLRAISTSRDGGQTWSKPKLDKNLPCPTCQASMISTENGELLFLNPASLKIGSPHSLSRRRLTLRSSSDEGRSWPRSLLIHAGPAGYSDLLEAKPGTAYCLFENGLEDYRERISFVEVDFDRD